MSSPPMGPRGGVVTQRSAKPCTPVQFWSWPPLIQSTPCADYLRDQGKPDRLYPAAYQPSGNGISGQAIWLSLAALGGSANIGSSARKSSCDAGSIAILTLSSNRLYSASLMALSLVREHTISKVFWSQIERIAQI